MTGRIPRQLASEPLIKLKSRSKIPVVDSRAVEPLPAIRDHLEAGGNVGVSLMYNLVVIDVDSPKMRTVVNEQLPVTFTVRSGGGGHHRYYRCEDWTDNKQFTVEGTDYGSIRTDGWQVVAPPSIHPETGDRYEVDRSVDIAHLEASELQAVIDTIAGRPWYHGADRTSQHQGGGGSSPAPPAGVGGDVAVPSSYPDRRASWSTLKKWLEANGFLTKLTSRGHQDDWSGHEFALAKCLAEGGFAASDIKQALGRLPPQAKWWHGSDQLTPEQYQDLTVRKAIEAAVADPYVEFSNDGERSSAPKPEEKKRENAPAWWVQRHTEPGGD